MIDAKDKQTLPIDLQDEFVRPQPKRRGRPATGKAMSNAERQRLHRERQKAQREELTRALERIAELEAGAK